jgi:hypothetical protein
MKLDLKTLALSVVTLLFIIFFSIWFFKGSGYKKQIKELKEKNRQIELIRDSLKLVNIKLEKDFNVIDKRMKKRNLEIKKIEGDLKKSKGEVNKLTNKLNYEHSQLEESKKKIDDLKKHPIKREGQDLINSLKSKTNL